MYQCRALSGMMVYCINWKLEAEDHASFKNCVSMEPAMFYELLQRLGLTIAKKDVEPQVPSSWAEVGHNLALPCYRWQLPFPHVWLQGRPQHDQLDSQCVSIIDIYEDEVVSCPSTEVGWRGIANRFGEWWQFQQAIGALDGKHVDTRRPNNCGSL